jgi:uncharacterized membrane protein YecN with MAPEG domain
MGTYFNYFASILTVVGFVITLSDVWKQFVPLKRVIQNIAFGVFLGAIIGTLISAKYAINFSEYGAIGAILVLLLAAMAIAAAASVYIGVIHGDANRRSEGFRSGWAILTLALMVMFWLNSSSITGGDEAKKLAADEAVAAAKWDIANGNTDRGINLLNDAISKFPINDPRRKAIDELIANAKKEEANGYLKP